MSKISPLAAIDPKATLAENVEVGPFCVIGPDVTIGAGTRLMAHVVVAGHTKIGKNNQIHPFAVLGDIPQDLKFAGETTRLEIGDNNAIREHVTMHTGTAYGARVNGNGTTRVGDNNLFMVNAHVGHDVQIGNRCIVANNVMLAGHVVLGNNVVLNGAVGVNAFVSVGDFSYIAAFARIHHDVPPFIKVSGDDEVRALNTTGMKRAGFDVKDIEAVEEAARAIFFSRAAKKSVSRAVAEFDTMNGINPHVKHMVEFLRRRDTGKHGRYLEGLRGK